METKIISIKDICPEGYKFDKERSTLDNLVFIEDQNYEHVSKELFYNKRAYYITSDGDISESNSSFTLPHMTDKNNCTSVKQAKKLLAINMLLNVAKYLNDGWEPNWDDADEKKYIIFLGLRKKINISCTILANGYIVYFKTEELAEQAIEILGEETIKLALSTDW